MQNTRPRNPPPPSSRMKEYHPPLGDRSGLRLDFNENTFACSPRVLEALGSISRGDLTRYPEREPVERARRPAPRPRARAGPAHQRRRRSDPRPLPDLPRRRHRAAAARPDLLHVRGLRLRHTGATSSPSRPRQQAFTFPLEALLAAITPATQPHRHRQSQQPHRPGRPARSDLLAHRRSRTARRRPRRRSLFPLPRRNHHRPGRPACQM